MRKFLCPKCGLLMIEDAWAVWHKYTGKAECAAIRESKESK